jgi:uncharacterized iron-regulated membrane protein
MCRVNATGESDSDIRTLEDAAAEARMVSSVRPIWLKIHRWLGLALAAFIIMAGITGAALAFHDELDAWINPHLFHVEPRGERLSPLVLRERAEQLVPEATFDTAPLAGGPEDAVEFHLGAKIDPATGEPYPRTVNQLYLDPYTGEELGRRMGSALGLDREHFMNTIFRLHRYLYMGETGSWILAVVAIAWVVSTVIGFYLTLPPSGRRSFRAWKPSWKVQWTAPLPKFSFDLHRAAGLWLWVMLFISALGAVRVTLGDAGALDKVLAVVAPPYDPGPRIEAHARAIDTPPISWEQALPLARRLMTERAAAEGIRLDGESSLSLDREIGMYVYGVRSSEDAFSSGETELYFSAVDGTVVDLVHPNRAAGSAVSSWLGALHRARVGGVPYKALVVLTGLAAAALAITGFIVWNKRRRPAAAR